MTSLPDLDKEEFTRKEYKVSADITLYGGQTYQRQCEALALNVINVTGVAFQNLFQKYGCLSFWPKLTDLASGRCAI